MPARSWKDLGPRSRRLLVVMASVDALARISALADLRRRPAGAIRGRRRTWALALALVNSAGALPLAYFLWGRRSAVPRRG